MNNETFFKKFREMEAEGHKGLKVEKNDTGLIVVTYEILDFLKLKDPADLDRYRALEKERNEITEEAKNSGRGWCEEDGKKIDEISAEMMKLLVMEHQSPTTGVRVYEPLMFIEERGLRDYEPSERHENSLVPQCLNYLRDRIAEDFESEIDIDAVKGIFFFCGLHGKGNPVKAAESLAREFDIADRITVFSTGTGRDREYSRGIVQIASGHRDEIENKINPHLKPPYIKCRNRFEQGIEGLDEMGNRI